MESLSTSFSWKIGLRHAIFYREQIANEIAIYVLRAAIQSSFHAAVVCLVENTQIQKTTIAAHTINY